MKEIFIPVYKLSQSRGIKNYQRRQNLIKGEVHFEGGSDSIANYDYLVTISVRPSQSEDNKMLLSCQKKQINME